MFERGSMMMMDHGLNKKNYHSKIGIHINVLKSFYMLIRFNIKLNKENKWNENRLHHMSPNSQISPNPSFNHILNVYKFLHKLIRWVWK